MTQEQRCNFLSLCRWIFSHLPVVLQNSSMCVDEKENAKRFLQTTWPDLRRVHSILDEWRTETMEKYIKILNSLSERCVYAFCFTWFCFLFKDCRVRNVACLFCCVFFLLIRPLSGVAEMTLWTLKRLRRGIWRWILVKWMDILTFITLWTLKMTGGLECRHMRTSGNQTVVSEAFFLPLHIFRNNGREKQL